MCKYIFYRIKAPFFGIFARPAEKNWTFDKNYQKTVIFSGILTGCIDKSIIKVNIGGFNMWFFITFFAFFCQKTSVPSVYVKTVTLDKLQKKYWIPNDAESGFLSYLFDTFCLLRIHVFCKASTELAKENTVLVSEIFIVYFFCVKWP